MTFYFFSLTLFWLRCFAYQLNTHLVRVATEASWGLGSNNNLLSLHSLLFNGGDFCAHRPRPQYFKQGCLYLGRKIWDWKNTLPSFHFFFLSIHNLFTHFIDQKDVRSFSLGGIKNTNRKLTATLISTCPKAEREKENIITLFDYCFPYYPFSRFVSCGWRTEIKMKLYDTH